MTPSELIARLRRIPLTAVQSSGVRNIGFDPDTRMVAVVFPGSGTVYGYPNLTDHEIEQFIRVREKHESLGHFVSTVVKKNHDHEHVVREEPAA